jgi:hypothetical protein
MGVLEGKVISSGYYCVKCELTAPACPSGPHPEGFPWEGRKCDWCHPGKATKQ